MYASEQTVHHFGSVPSRRLTDRIRELCTQAARASDANFGVIMAELQTALHEQAVKTREMAIKQITGRKERRLRKMLEEPCDT